jgi:type IV fimbrial biogenesis protein FimT
VSRVRGHRPPSPRTRGSPPSHACEAGITLVESLISVTVCALLVMLGAPQFGAAVRDSRVRAITEEYSSGLSLAKQEAVARNVRVQFQPSGTGWRIGLLAADGSLGTILLSRTGLNTEARYSVTASATAFTFNGAGRATTPGPTSYTVDLGLVGGTCKAAGGDVRCLRVTVTPGGAIKACDPAAQAGDPRACA